jgi:hypothetical protein
MLGLPAVNRRVQVSLEASSEAYVAVSLRLNSQEIRRVPPATMGSGLDMTE